MDIETNQLLMHSRLLRMAQSLSTTLGWTKISSSPGSEMWSADSNHRTREQPLLLTCSRNYVKLFDRQGTLVILANPVRGNYYLSVLGDLSLSINVKLTKLMQSDAEWMPMAGMYQNARELSEEMRAYHRIPGIGPILGQATVTEDIGEDVTSDEVKHAWQTSSKDHSALQKRIQKLRTKKPPS